MLLYWANVLKEVSVRYLIASDIHGSLPAAEALLARFHEEGADRLLLLGDVLYHGPRNPLPAGYAPAEVAQLLNRYADRITAVRGNCDAEVDQMVLDFPCLGDYALVVDGAPPCCSPTGTWTSRKSLKVCRPVRSCSRATPT